MTKLKILATGGSGQVGCGLHKAAHAFDYELVMPSSRELDLSNEASIRAFLSQGEWSAIISSGAYTAVDKAESEPDRAFAINGVAPGILAAEAASRNIPIIHVSTDYVFDGSKPSPYVEEDPVAPLGVYGASKEAGERAVRESGARDVILRTAWVMSPWGNNFVKTMLRLAADRPELRVVADQHGCPTSAQDIAVTLLTLADRLITDPAAPTGTYHFVNAGDASWYDLACAVFERVGKHGHPVPKVDAITTADYPTPAKRPANSRLSTGKINRDFGVQPRGWTDALDEIVEKLFAA
jgi:dTDP-4-dehydrorhamnose reductase